MFSTTRHVSFSTEPGFRYFSDGPLISALASIDGATCTNGKRRGGKKAETLFSLSGMRKSRHDLNTKLEIDDNDKTNQHQKTLTDNVQMYKN